jgi:hypothetical protein
MDDWRLACSARANLLVIGLNGPIDQVVDSLGPDVGELIGTWCCGERLALPPSGKRGTVILHGVSGLPHADQVTLLGWLEQSDRAAQVVSTSLESLLPRVEAGTFIDTLYYRLNTICVEVSL